MGALREISRAVVEGLAPSGDLFRLRFRVSLEGMATLGIVLLAVALAVGYQVLPRLGTRFGWLRPSTER